VRLGAAPRWSRLSLENAGRSIFVPFIVYFIAGGSERSPRMEPARRARRLHDDRVDARVGHRPEHGERVAVVEYPAPARADDRRPPARLLARAVGRWRGRDVTSALIAPQIPTRSSRPRSP
jgi:hypothetical protein